MLLSTIPNRDNSIVYEKLPDGIINHVDEYFTLKGVYHRHLRAIVTKNEVGNIMLKITDSEGKDIGFSYPLYFSQDNNSLSVSIVDDVDPTRVYYTKQIILGNSINVYNQIDYLLDKIESKNNYYYNLFSILFRNNSLQYNTSLLNELHSVNKTISDSEFKLFSKAYKLDKSAIEKEYQTFKSQYNRYLIELEILRKIVLESNEYNEDSFNIYLFSDLMTSIDSLFTFYNVKNMDSKDARVKPLLYQLECNNKIKYQKFTDRRGSIVKAVENEQYYILNDAIDFNDKAGTVSVTSVSDGANLVVNISGLEPIYGTYYKFKQLSYNTPIYISISELNSKLAEYGYNNVYPDNKPMVLDKNYGKLQNYYKKTAVKYLITEAQSNEQLKHKKPIDVINNIKLEQIRKPLDGLYESNNVIFMFYSQSKDMPPGKGVREYIDGNHIDTFRELQKIPNWRQKLSNFYIEKTVATNQIVPIVIDGLVFSSVEHYFHYSKFNSREEMKPGDAIKYQNYANRFVLSFKNKYTGLEESFAEQDGNVIKAAGGKNSGYEIPKDWDKSVGQGLSKRDKILIKALYAKFTQHSEAASILRETKFALLIHPAGGSVRSAVNEYAYHHMVVRKHIAEHTGPEFYTNVDSDMELFRTILEKLEQNYRLYDILEQKDTIAPIVRAEANIVLSKADELLKSDLDQLQNKYTIDKLDKSIADMYRELYDKVQLERARLYGDKERLTTYLFSLAEFEKRDMLSYVDDSQSLYFAIVELLYKYQISPMTLGSNKYSLETRLVKTGEINRGLYYNAVNQLVEDMTSKYSVNSNSEHKDQIIDLIKNAKKYPGHFELYLCSALLNININVYSNGKRTVYNYEQAIKFFPIGLQYNLDSKTTTIDLGVYGNFYYIAISPMNNLDLELNNNYELMEGYYFIAMLDGEVDVNIACYVDNETAYSLGYYDEYTRVISYKPISDNLREQLEPILETVDTTDNRLRQIHYFKDIETGKVYIEKDGKNLEVGLWTTDKAGQPYIKFSPVQVEAKLVEEEEKKEEPVSEQAEPIVEENPFELISQRIEEEQPIVAPLVSEEPVLISSEPSLANVAEEDEEKKEPESDSGSESGSSSSVAEEPEEEEGPAANFTTSKNKNFINSEAGIRLGNINIAKLSGPIGLGIQVPKDNLYKKYKSRGIKLPVLFSMGDAHASMTNECLGNQKDSYNIAKPEFINAMELRQFSGLKSDYYLEAFHATLLIREFYNFLETKNTDKLGSIAQALKVDWSDIKANKDKYIANPKLFIEDIYRLLSKEKQKDHINYIYHNNLFCFLHELKTNPKLTSEYGKYYDQYCRTDSMRWQFADPRFMRYSIPHNKRWLESLVSRIDTELISKEKIARFNTAIDDLLANQKLPFTKKELLTNVFSAMSSLHSDISKHISGKKYTNLDKYDMDKSTIPKELIDKLIYSPSLRDYSIVYKQISQLPQDLQVEWKGYFYKYADYIFRYARDNAIKENTNIGSVLANTEVYLVRLKSYLLGETKTVPRVPKDVASYLTTMLTITNDIYFITRMLKQGGSDIVYTLFGNAHTIRMTHFFEKIVGYDTLYFKDKERIRTEKLVRGKPSGKFGIDVNRCLDLTDGSVDLNKVLEHLTKL